MPDSEVPPNLGAEAGDSAEASPSKPRLQKKPLRFLFILFASLVGLFLLAALALLSIAALFRESVTAHLPKGFEVYVSVPSASAFTDDALRLKALDAILSRNAGLRSTVRSLRASPFLRSEQYRRL